MGKEGVVNGHQWTIRKDNAAEKSQNQTEGRESAGNKRMASRKIGKTHQNVLIFIKGDPKKATAAVGKVEIFDVQNEIRE